MSKKHCDPGLANRCRAENGRTRAKNGGTLVGTLRKTYGENFASSVRSDMKLNTLLRRKGASSLSDLIKKS
jgi:hypothetical protein